MRDAERSADLAARYARMGFEATGSWSGAAAHYHGGPNRRLWGPKTRAYAAAVGGRPFAVATDLSRAPRGTFGTAPIIVASFMPTDYR
jgi:soluble lytic murein transglycosylase-like protein